METCPAVVGDGHRYNFIIVGENEFRIWHEDCSQRIDRKDG